jgi:hypothetical protein
LASARDIEMKEVGDNAEKSGNRNLKVTATGNSNNMFIMTKKL